MNYINYINYTKTPSDSTCLGEPLGGFCDVGFVVALYLLFFFIHIFFSTSSLTLPWTIARFLDPFCTFSPAHCRVIHDSFIFNHSVIFLPWALRFWVGTGFFYLMLLPEILAQPAFIKVSLGAGSYFLESCRASYWSSKHRPGPSVCLIHSNPQSFIHLKFVFIHVNIAKVLLVVKTLIRSAATLFSSHENIKQQPN